MHELSETEEILNGLIVALTELQDRPQIYVPAYQPSGYKLGIAVAIGVIKTALGQLERARDFEAECLRDRAYGPDREEA